MTAEEYGRAYGEGFIRTVRLLIMRGLCCDGAQELAQAAWVRGWERVAQLRDPKMVVTWINAIALNMFRTSLRRGPFLQELPEVLIPPTVNFAAIDVQRILTFCRKKDRLVLQRHYLEGHEVREIAQAHGWSETAVRIRLLRARRAAAKTLVAVSRSMTALALATSARVSRVAIQMPAELREYIDYHGIKHQEFSLPLTSKGAEDLQATEPTLEQN
jgi:RNA polymerase sigma factor (sigma-70 family)